LCVFFLSLTPSEPTGAPRAEPYRLVGGVGVEGVVHIFGSVEHPAKKIKERNNEKKQKTLITTRGARTPVEQWQRKESGQIAEEEGQGEVHLTSSRK
jgi:hypothetical protein